MTEITKEKLDTLIQLQKIEIEIFKVRNLIEITPGKIALLEKNVNMAHADLEEKNNQLEAVKKEYRSQELNVKENQDKIKKNQNTLTTVKTNKEYHALLKGIDELKDKNSKIEDQMIEWLDKIDLMEKQVEESRSELEKKNGEIEQEKKRLSGEVEKAEKLYSELEVEKQKISSQVDPALLKIYEQVKKRCDGQGMAPVKDSICFACNMNIPPQMYNELQRYDSLKFCPFCHRILYWENDG